MKLLKLFPLLPFFITTSYAAPDWQVEEAVLRYTVELESRPTTSSAGYFIQLPDGGILSGAAPLTTVKTDQGQDVPSYLFFHNTQSGFSLVFADPGKKVDRVHVYVQPTTSPNLWTPESEITPSAVLAVRPGRASQASAQSLGKLGSVEPEVHIQNEAGISKAPLSIGGDLSGRPRPASFYLLAHVEAPATGEYWIAPVTVDGETSVSVNGDRLSLKERGKGWGSRGDSVELEKGTNLIEIFQTAEGKGPYSSHNKQGGLVIMAWKPPKEKLPKGHLVRTIDSSEILRSGSASLVSVDAKDGAPVAAAEIVPQRSFWIGEEEPLITYGLTAYHEGQPEGTTYTWTLTDDAQVNAEETHWVFPGFTENEITLTAQAGDQTSTATYSIFAYSTTGTDLNFSNHREDYRIALTTMLESFGENSAPVLSWSDAWWNNIIRTIEGDEGFELLIQLFTHHEKVARRKLEPEQIQMLQNLLLDQLQQRDPTKTLEWVKTFLDSASGSERDALRLREGELKMIYFDQKEEAAEIFKSISEKPGEFTDLATIRLGDHALLSGDLNLATSRYAEVQNRARKRRNSLKLSADSVDASRGALQEVSLSENVQRLIYEEFYMEARRSLQDWELEFPLSKVSGDFIIQEATLYSEIEDWKRAQVMLAAYCREIDASSFLPKAAEMLIESASNLDEPPSSLREIIESVRDRLKFHPAAAELDSYLSSLDQKNP
ncbi:MAG: hypothetical protein AAFY98_01045 [Verrucomicrobiota bacterium]